MLSGVKSRHFPKGTFYDNHLFDQQIYHIKLLVPTFPPNFFRRAKRAHICVSNFQLVSCVQLLELFCCVGRIWYLCIYWLVRLRVRKGTNMIVILSGKAEGSRPCGVRTRQQSSLWMDIFLRMMWIKWMSVFNISKVINQDHLQLFSCDNHSFYVDTTWGKGV